MSSSHRAGEPESALQLTRLAFGLILALGLPACGALSDQAVPEPPTVEEPPLPAMPLPTQTGSACDTAGWSLEFEKSGGMMGIHRSLTLDSKGNAVAVDVRKGTQAASSVGGERTDRVAAMLQALCPFESAGRAAGCVDCFEYALAIRWGNRNVRLKATDVSLAERGLEPLVGELNALLEEVLGDGK